MMILIIFSSIIFISFVVITIVNWMNHPLNKKTKPEDITFTTAISAMNRLQLLKITLNDRNSLQIRKKALYYLRRDDSFLYYKVINRYNFLKLRISQE